MGHDVQGDETMRRVLLALAVVVSVAAQDPRETRIPEGHYCKRVGVPISKNETKAHSCECTYSCSIDADGNVTERESEACMAWCHKGGRHCTCHTEAPCPSEGHNALADMDGHVVAVKVRHRR